MRQCVNSLALFESSVNSEGIETGNFSLGTTLLFESSVNSEGIETWTLEHNTR